MTTVWAQMGIMFSSLFLVELPDKTSLAAITLAARGRALEVWLGASAALIVQTAVAVAFGRVLAYLPVLWVHVGEALLFIGFAVWVWRASAENETLGARSQQPGRTAGRAFLVVLAAEFGDLTQFATAGWAARFPTHVLLVGVVAAIALVTASALSVTAGQWLLRVISARWLQRAAALIFLGVGVASVMQAGF
ncbi:MAG: TMEM165/GDT1 family protein [Thermaerobacter sp.]|nr:TMEM165/GDT1 family protein [Thermaerobacter sp.]